jgi:hypothetical protein
MKKYDIRRSACAVADELKESGEAVSSLTGKKYKMSGHYCLEVPCDSDRTMFIACNTLDEVETKLRREEGEEMQG